MSGKWTIKQTSPHSRQMPFSLCVSSAPAADTGAFVVNFLPRRREQGIHIIYWHRCLAPLPGVNADFNDDGENGRGLVKRHSGNKSSVSANGDKRLRDITQPIGNITPLSASMSLGLDTKE